MNCCLHFTAISEAQKCLFNLVFSHTPSRLMISNSSAAEAALLRISSVTEIPSIPHEVLLFDLKILFLLTALCISCRCVYGMNYFFSLVTIKIIWLHRPAIRYSSQGIHRLVKLLDTCLVQGVDQLTNDSVALCCESLKVIFNLLLPATENDSADSSSSPPIVPEEDLQVQRRLMYIIRLLLSVKSNSLEKREDLKRFFNIFFLLYFLYVINQFLKIAKLSIFWRVLGRIAMMNLRPLAPIWTRVITAAIWNPS